jgi:hypothetical protein
VDDFATRKNVKRDFWALWSCVNARRRRRRRRRKRKSEGAG